MLRPAGHRCTTEEGIGVGEIVGEEKLGPGPRALIRIRQLKQRRKRALSRAGTRKGQSNNWGEKGGAGFSKSSEGGEHGRSKSADHAQVKQRTGGGKDKRKETMPTRKRSITKV